MYCSNCGQELRDSGTYCSKCGNKARANESPTVANLSHEKEKPNKTKRNALIISAVCGVCLFAAIFFIFRDSDDGLDVDVSPPSGNTSITSTKPRENESPAVNPAPTRKSIPVYRDTIVSIEQDLNDPPQHLFDMNTGEIHPEQFTPAYPDYNKGSLRPVERWYAFPDNVKYGDATTPTTISFWVDYNFPEISDMPLPSVEGFVYLREAKFDSLFNLNLVPEMISNEYFEVSSESPKSEVTVRFYFANDGVLEERIVNSKSTRATYLPTQANELVDYFPYDGTPIQRVITGANFTVTTPAGVFENCIEVYTTLLHTRTYFAPGIGEVLVMSLVNDGVNKPTFHAPESLLVYHKIH